MPKGVIERFDPVADGTEELTVHISAVDGVTESIKRYAVDKVRHVAAKVGEPVLFASVAFRHLDNPAAVRPARVAALLDVNGRTVRAHGAAPTYTEAIDELADRLARRVRSQPVWSRSEYMPPRPGEWRHDNRPSAAATERGAVIHRVDDGPVAFRRAEERGETDVP